MIADKLYSLKSFKRQYEAVLILSVSRTIPKLLWNESEDDLLSRIDWNNILGIASVLSYSDNSLYLDAALRISQTCISHKSTNEVQKNASAVILSNLTNKPAIDLAVKRGLVNENYQDNYPLEFKLQTVRNQMNNSILLNDELVILNKFQAKVYRTYKNYETISISAPTSAGKSFILCTILVEEVKTEKKNIIYIVPTRALISQVENDLKDLFSKYEVKNFNISTVPQSEVEEEKSNVFIFTQERLHWFLLESSLKIDLMVVDEAHKIEDGNRGILLQQKIEDVVRINPNLKVYFSSPFTSNPELLLENIKNNSKKEKVNTQFVSVNQNLIYATQFPRKSDVWNLNLILMNKKILLGQIKLKDRPNTFTKKVTYISQAIAENYGGNIIYANGAAEAENKAVVLYNLLEDQRGTTESLKELQKLIKKIIHKDYILAKVITKGVAFHYGNMPLLLRQQIEKLFKAGDIKYLVCTSTLLEGINLPSKSIFIRKPTRGRNTPLNANDFWNLAGRAGRWGKEFSGNIICIDPQDWETQPDPEKTKQYIKRAVDEVEKQPDELVQYIVDKSPRKEAEKRQDLEFAFGYFYIRFLDDELNMEKPIHNKLHSLFTEIQNEILIPDYILRRNPGISPLAQQQLYNYFEENANRISELIPVYPEDENAVDDYIKLVGRIGKTIAHYPPALNFSRAILLTDWMQGKPLSLLISHSYNYYKKKKKPKPLPTVIREVMGDVENFVRFRFAKDSGCYVDILRYFLEINKKHNLLSQLPELNLWLEFGVSQKTHLSLLSLGLTRNTVIEISNLIPNSQMSKRESLKWLQEMNFEQMDLSPIIVEDIKNNLD